MKRLLLFSALTLTVSAISAQSQPKPDLKSDTWVATDALGRQVARAGEAGVPAPREGKSVVMFYYIWHGFHSPIGPNDITKILAADPVNPKWGPNGSFHWWGEPEAGYYRAEDPWVIRRNMSMLADAGVDAIFFDVTNAETYPNTVKEVCETIRSMHAMGDPAPQIGFVIHSRAAQTQKRLWDEMYSKGLYSDLWFRWKGKPLIMGERDAKFPDGAEQSDEIKNFFTWRYSWAWQPGQGKWPWLDTSPQRMNPDPDDPNLNEETPVATASHPTSYLGKSYQNGAQPAIDQYGLTPVTNEGRYFEQQWQGALKLDPEAVFVTQWNEWVAQRFTVEGASGPGFLGKPTKKGDTFFVDVYNAEFNRDIEPMKGGWNDNYYLQLVSNIRKYKGARAVESTSKPQTMKLGDFAAWKAVSPEYRDTQGDTMHRDFKGYAGDLRYLNTTGRNDIVSCKVARDKKNVYFYARTAAPLSPSTDFRWMQLFLNTDQSNSTGWNGYDYAINTRVLNGKETTVAKWNGTGWAAVGRARFVAKNNELEIVVPRALLGFKGEVTSIDFHWTDNASPKDLSDWMVSGDSAPNRRFNFRYDG
ncbi:hypothetical protein IAD21_01104 [Abditibacteriota bacterium]|nr:hypothetical protein IAD21_01104 [Abditibacteriota bacterium]